MNKIEVTGTQSFMGVNIPVVLGGFGEDKKCISDKTVAEIHNQPVPEIRRRITDNIKRFEIGKDALDLKVVVQNDDKIVMGESHDNLLFELGYTQMQISKAEHIYLLSERGYAKLIKIMDTDLAWEIHDKLMDEYFELREEKRQGLMISEAREIELKAKAMRAEAMQLNARTRAFKEIKESIPRDQLSDVALKVFNLKGAENLTGETLGCYLPKTKKTYSATEVGNRLGVSKNKIGKLANVYGLKTDEYGITVMDKSPYCSKNVPSFRYYENAVQKLKEIVSNINDGKMKEKKEMEE